MPKGEFAVPTTHQTTARGPVRSAWESPLKFRRMRWRAPVAAEAHFIVPGAPTMVVLIVIDVSLVRKDPA